MAPNAGIACSTRTGAGWGDSVAQVWLVGHPGVTSSPWPPPTRWKHSLRSSLCRAELAKCSEEEAEAEDWTPGIFALPDSLNCTPLCFLFWLEASLQFLTPGVTRSYPWLHEGGEQSWELGSLILLYHLDSWVLLYLNPVLPLDSWDTWNNAFTVLWTDSSCFSVALQWKETWPIPPPKSAGKTQMLLTIFKHLPQSNT